MKRRGLARWHGPLGLALLFALVALPVAAHSGPEGPRPLTARGVENLAAAAELWGLVRYFHPADEGEKAHWDALAYQVVHDAEGAANPAELALVLERVFQPVAPTLQVVVSGSPAPSLAPELTIAPSEPARLFAWRHWGVQGAEQNPAYGSRREALFATAGEQRARLFQRIEALPAAASGELVLTAHVRLDPGAGEPRVELFVRALPGGSRLAAAATRGDAGWQALTAREPLPAGTTALEVGVELHGTARVALDELSLTLGGAPLALTNAGFEAGRLATAPEGWSTDLGPAEAGYQALTGGREPVAGAKVGLLVGKLPVASAADPRPEVLTVALAGGVTAYVPRSLWATAEGTLPRAKTNPPRRATRGWFVEDRPVRLAGVVMAWSTFHFFYPYFAEVGVDWRAELPRALRTAATDGDAAAYQATLERLVAALDDGHGMVAREDAPKPDTLALAWEWVEGQLVVTASEGSPARGEVVLALDGVPLAERVAELGTRVSAAREPFRRHVIARRLRGCETPGAVRTLRVQGATGAPRDVEVPCRTYTVDLPPPREARPVALGELEPGLWYVDLTRLQEAELAEHWDELAAARGVVFDVRGYPTVRPSALQHLTQVWLRSAYFEVPIVERPGEVASWDLERWNLTPLAPRVTAPRVFLTDERAISYAESLLGIVEAYRLGEIVGAATAGTNGDVNTLALPGGFRIHFTGLRVRKHDETRHHGVGILPTVPVERTLEGVRAGRDEVLERGLGVVKGAWR